ncbi:MAG TPA: hypothetical protein DD789_13385 [Firmicutes bacterium]|nr:hypothetical protein [Bacillota bacterium]
MVKILGLTSKAKVGLFTLIILALLSSGWLWLNGQHLLDRSYPLVVEFTHVGGLRPGAPVQMAGVDIGRVGSVELTPTGKVLAVLNIKPQVRLGDDALVTIGTIGLLGEKMVEIIPGPGRNPLPPASRLQGQEPFNTEDLLRETGAVLSALKRIVLTFDHFFTAEETLNQLGQTTANLDTITRQLAAFSSKLTTADLATIFTNLEATSARLAMINYEEINTILAAAADLSALSTQLNAFIAGFEPFQTELTLLMTELRAGGQTGAAVTQILSALVPTATNLERLSIQLTDGEPNLADLLADTEEMLISVQLIANGLNRLLEETATEGSADLFKSSMEKAGRVFNLADDFLETYDQLSLHNNISLSATAQDWGLDFQSQLAWGTKPFLLFGCTDLGDRNRLSLQFGVEQKPYQFRLGIFHNWLGFGFNYNYRNFGFQADLWQPSQPVLDLYTEYRLDPAFLKVGIQNVSTPTQQWEVGLGWNF